MPFNMLRSVGHMLLYIFSSILLTNMIGLALATSFITSINPVIPENMTDQFSPGHYAIPMTDNRGKSHDSIISTVSLDIWYATTASTCINTTDAHSGCAWNQNALYNPTGVSTGGTRCSIGVKSPINKYPECYSIMPNVSIILGDNTAQNPDLQLYTDVGLLLNSTWDGSSQSGILGSPLLLTSVCRLVRSIPYWVVSLYGMVVGGNNLH